MFGKTVYVRFKGKLEKVLVPCIPNTPYDILKERALNMLKQWDEEKKQKEQEYRWNNLDEYLS